jgi:dihydropteroate synthase
MTDRAASRIAAASPHEARHAAHLPSANAIQPATHWRLNANHTLGLSHAHVVAVLNVTPDSFSDGGRLHSTDAAVNAARDAVAVGASVLDVGGESTRPGAERVPADEQTRRVVPAIRAIRDAGVRAPITIDTTLADVAQAALEAGADAINDVSAGAESGGGTLRLAAERQVGLVLMHRLRPPDADRYSHQYQHAPNYDDAAREALHRNAANATSSPHPAEDSTRATATLPPVVIAVRDALRKVTDRALAAGVRRDALALDMGLGFGKSVGQNLDLIRHADAFVADGPPVFAGASRKSFLGKLTGVERPDRRLAGSLAAAAALHHAGVRLIRVHDVREHAQVFAVLDAIARRPDGAGPD